MSLTIYRQIQKLEAAGFTRPQVEAILELIDHIKDEVTKTIEKRMLYGYGFTESCLEKSTSKCSA